METTDILNFELYIDPDPIALGVQEAYRLLERNYMPNHFTVSKGEADFLCKKLPNATKTYDTSYGLIDVVIRNVKLPVREANSDLKDQWRVEFVEHIVSVK